MINIYVTQGNHKNALKYLDERIKQIESGIIGDYYEHLKDQAQERVKIKSEENITDGIAYLADYKLTNK